MILNNYLSQRGRLRSIHRFGMEYTLQKQNLCEHGYGVGNLFFLICRDLKIPITAEHLMAVMNHDFVESYTGDLNLQIKETNHVTRSAWSILEREAIPRSIQFLTDVGLEEYLGTELFPILQFSDALDAYLYTLDEISLGNTRLTHAMNHYRHKVFNLFSFPGVEHILSLVRKNTEVIYNGLLKEF